MTAGVDAWRQAGNLHVWRYGVLNRSRRGWHFAADHDGCASMIDLIARMVAGAVPSHRTIRLGTVTSAIWGLPNFGPPRRDRFEKLRIEYCPEEVTLSLNEIEGRLTLRCGEKRAASLSAAFNDLAAGLNDFGIATSDDKHADAWWFW